MSQHPDRRDEAVERDQTPKRDPEQALDQLDEADFASEHASPTFADQQAGGPEGANEPEAPQGYAGLESDRGARRKKPDG